MLVGIGALALGGGDGDDNASDASTTVEAAPTSTLEPATTTSDVEATTTTPAATEAPTTPPTTTTTTAAPETTPPATTAAPATTTSASGPPATAGDDAGFGPGNQVVGDDIEPGVYMATELESFCYWERLSGLGGSLDEVIVNDIPSGQAIVEILPGDTAFSSDGCGPWTAYQPPQEPADTFGDGDWAVGEQIQPGRYEAESTDELGCYWERSSGFTHELEEIIANDVPEGRVVVEIEPGDVRFSSTCGTWTPMG